MYWGCTQTHILFVGLQRNQKLWLNMSLLAGTNAGDVEKLVPADALLLAGTCIVDEAVLTGESTPQWKAPVGTPDGDQLTAQAEGLEHRLSIKRDKNHVLFSGTKLLQHTGDKDAHIKTPDGACLAIVLRTGFETSQGIPCCHCTIISFRGNP